MGAPGARIIMKKTFVGLVVLASAQGVGAQETVVLDPVVVSASRAPITLSEVPGSVTVIDRAEIERRQQVHVADLLRSVAGVSVSRSGTAGSQTQVRLRGAESNHVLVLIDGVEANDPASGDEFRWEQLTTFDVERIEIVRGPQSALWGSDALAGVVNIITRRQHAEPGAGVFFEGGSFGTVYGGANARTASDRFSASFGAAYLDSDGSNISRQGGEDDGYRNVTLSGAAGFEASEALALELGGRYIDAENDFDAIDYFETGLPVDADRVSKNESLFLSSAASLSLFDDFWANQLRVTFADSDNDNDSDGVADGSTAANTLGFFYQGGIEFVAGPGAAQHAVTVALEHERVDFHQRGAATEYGDPNQDQNLDSTAYAAEYLLRALEGWLLSASLRYDENSDFDNEYSWRIASSYRFFSSGSRLHASIGKGHKAPTFIERFGFFPDLFIGNPDLRPEESLSWEAGIDQPLPGGRAEIGFTYFEARLEDEINGFVMDPDTFLFTATNGAGTSHRNGVEATFSARLSEHVGATASYTYTNSKEPQSGGGHERELRRPRHMAAANLNYVFAANRANVNVALVFTGEREDIFFPPFPAESEVVTLDSYSLVNVAASYRVTARAELYGRIENLLDEDYEDIYGFANPGIGAFAGLRMTFGD